MTATERVATYLKAVDERLPGEGDHIHGVGTLDGTVRLLRSDLRALLATLDLMRRERDDYKENRDDYRAAFDRAAALHNSDGHRTFGRLFGQPMPDPEGEAYCTNCGQSAPCSTAQALGAES